MEKEEATKRVSERRGAKGKGMGPGRLERAQKEPC